MTETQQRFLRAIGERVPMDQVVELHLFPPIRQGGVETGVAVVAEQTRQPGLAQAEVDVANAPYDAGAPENGQVDAALPAEAAILSDGEQSEAVDVELAAEPSDLEVKATAELAANAARVAMRLTIHTARYRLTLKGADRGKWEVEVVAEADAPLEAVDAVVRGVQRRGGEGAEPDRLSTEALREALDAPLASLDQSPSAFALGMTGSATGTVWRV